MTILGSAGADHLVRRSATSDRLTNSGVWSAVFVIISLVLLAVGARDGLGNLYERWAYEPEYGYGFLVVLLVPFFLWTRGRDLIAKAEGSGWVGLPVLLVAQSCAILAVLAESYYIEQLAFVFSLFAVALVAIGARGHKLLAPLLVLLLMTVPLPYTLQAILTIKLQLLSTNLGVFLIRLIEIPVYVEGNIIDLGIYKLQVAEACSGLRYLLPMACISFLIAYLYKGRFWKKAFIVLSSAPLTIAINSFRIAVTAVLVDNFGIRSAEGFIHEFEGWVVFLMGVMLLCFEIFALEGFRWNRVEFEHLWNRSTAPQKPGKVRKSLLPLLLATLICAGSVGISTSLALSFKSPITPARDSFVGFPTRLGNWTGHAEELDSQTVGMLKATDYYLGDFSEVTRTMPVNLFVAYYDSLNKGAAIHSPRVCLPGAGWEFASFQERKLADIVPGLKGTYNRAVIQNGTQKILMYYWYQQGSRRTANEFSMKYYLLVDSIIKHRQDGALVRLFTPIDATTSDKGVHEAEVRLNSFFRATLRPMEEYLPR